MTHRACADVAIDDAVDDAPRRRRLLRFIPVGVAGAVYAASVVWPFLFSVSMSSAFSPARRSALLWYTALSSVSAIALWSVFAVFRSPTLRLFLGKTDKARKYGPSVLLVWAWVSLVGATELSVLLALDVVPSAALYAAEFVAHSLVFAQFAMFSRLSPSPRFLSLSCMFVCSLRVFEAPSFAVVFAVFGSRSPALALAVAVAVPLSVAVVGFRHTLPPLKVWECYSVPATRSLSPLCDCCRLFAEHNDRTRGDVRRMKTPCLEKVATPPIPSDNMPSATATTGEGIPLRVVQITDPHLGPVTTPDVLRAFCAEVADVVKPDLVLITGDMLTTECYKRAQDSLAYALEPLSSLEGRVFACLGNHDHEARAEVMGAFKRVGVRLLMDEEAVVRIGGRTVQVIGIDYRSQLHPQTCSAIAKICHDNPRPSDCTHRIVLLHDPATFRYIPSNDGSVVLSGHTHGGIMGVVGKISLISIANTPDNGLFRRGSNVLYVHRGQGSRSLLGNVLVRFFVPAEKSILLLN